MAGEVEVIFEGVLYFSLNAKDWNQRLFVLKLDKVSKTAMLDYYKDKKKRWQKQEVLGSIALPHSFRISLAHGCSYKFPLMLISYGKAFYLSAASFSNMNTWYHQIQLTKVLSPTQQGIFEFEVSAKPSESIDLITAKGNCILAFTTSNEVICATMPLRQVLGVWPFDSLRRYFCKENLFGFEAGRRSPRGEGLFEFFTSQNEEIYRILEQCIKKAKTGEPRPPVPPPTQARKSLTPPVSTSSSDDEPFSPRHTPQKAPPQKSDSFRGRPSAAPQLRRVQTHSGAHGGSQKEVQKWLQDAYEQPPVMRPLSPLEDDTYSHTVHKYNPPVRDPPSLISYHRLHDQGSRQASVLSNLAEEDSSMYDVAYPDKVDKGSITDEGYAKLGTPDPSRVVRQPTQTRAPLNKGISDEELTINPMYGSQENILKAIDKLEGASKPVDFVDSDLQNLQISPAYEQHQLKNTEPTTSIIEESKESGKTSKYSTVNKKPTPERELSTEEPVSRGETPPPLPERCYSTGSTNSEPTSTGQPEQ